MQDLAVSDFPVVRFVECSLFFIQLFQASFSCPPAATSIHKLQDESTSCHERNRKPLHLLKEIVKREPEKWIRNRRNSQNSSSARVGPKYELKRSSTEKRGGVQSDIYDKTRKRESSLLKTLERHLWKEHTICMEYDFECFKQRAQNTGKQSFQNNKGFPYFDETICRIAIFLFWHSSRRLLSINGKSRFAIYSTALVFADAHVRQLLT